jgi:glycolate oxidase FAD binding subunit
MTTATNPAPPAGTAPETAEQLAECLRDAAARGQAIVPWGAGTLQHLGKAPAPGAQTLPTIGLARVLEYTPADLTITAEAGAALGDIQAALREHGQWLPWDPPAPAHATLGGLLAAGASGPLRLGYGTPRDWVLGMRVALGDGRLVKSGGKVVKNVAGYDTHKVHIGALGTLGVIVEATLKVAPLPERFGSAVFGCGTPAAAIALAERLRERPLAPASVVVCLGMPLAGLEAPALVAARYAGVGAAVERQLGAALERGRAAGVEAEPLDHKRAEAAWAALAGFAAPAALDERAMIIRAGGPVAALARVLEALREHMPAAEVVGYAGVGLAYARWPAGSVEVESVAGALTELRATLAAQGGYAVVERAPAELRAALDLWGEPPATLALMRGIKAQWDPHGLLNRGRYVGGI